MGRDPQFREHKRTMGKAQVLTCHTSSHIGELTMGKCGSQAYGGTLNPSLTDTRAELVRVIRIDVALRMITRYERCALHFEGSIIHSSSMPHNLNT